MEDYSHIHQVVLKHPADLPRDIRPTVSLAILARPEDLRVDRLLDEVVPHVDEVVFVAVDVSPQRMSEYLSHPSLSGKLHQIVEVNVDKYPELYFKDVPETYRMGTPLGNEVFSGPYSGRYLISDWSKVRNLGWKRCAQEWRVTLDGDDMMINPSYIASVCEAMNEFGSELGYSTHLRPTRGLAGEVTTSVLSGRIAKNGSAVHWVGEAREVLEGGYRASIIEGSLVVVKATSNHSCESDVEQFKRLYAHARRMDWQISPCNLLYMAQLASLVGMEDFSQVAITTHLETSLYTEERAWACALRGEGFESQGDYENASKWYERSLAEHPSFKSAYRLCRSRFMEKKWQGCLDAFQIGVENDNFIHMVDDGAEDKSRAFILVAAALAQLGRIEEARTCGQTLRQLFPSKESVIKMCEVL